MMITKLRPQDDDLDVRSLRAMLPPPAAAPLTAQQADRLEQALLTTMAEPDRAARLRLTARDNLGTAMTMVLVALVGLVALLVPHSSERGVDPLPIAASPAAARVLDAAAAAALRAPSVPVGEDQYVYVRSLVFSNEGRFGAAPSLGRAHDREIWLSQRPVVSGERDDVIREFGQLWPIDHAGGPLAAGISRPTTRWLATLPTDPDTLLRTLRSDLAGTQWATAWRDQDQALFWAIGQMISENVVPPATQAALLRAVMRIGGVTTVTDVTDAAGRAGLGITRLDRQYRSRDVWILDRRTYSLLGTRSYDLGTVVPNGGVRVHTRQQLFNATAVLERAVVDAKGDRP